MKIPTEITFRDMDPSPAVEDRIYDEAAKLEEFHSGIMSCRVMVEIPHEHHKLGKRFHVRVDLKMPGGEIVARRVPSLHGATKDIGLEVRGKKQEVAAVNKDIYVAIRDAFKSARRQLQDFAQKQRGEVKYHESGAAE
jgi:ribosome-associated translation inhibitor RaiA